MSTTTTGSAVRPVNEAEQRLIAAWRTVALKRMPYFAAMLFGLRFVSAPGLGTFAVDKQWRCYIDFEACEPRGIDWCADAMLHECGHLWQRHADQSELMNVQPQDRYTANIAADLAINDDLVQCGCETLADVVPSKVNLPDNQTFAFYFRELMKRQPKQPNGQGQPGQGSSQGQPGQGQQGQGQPGDGDPFNGCGSGSGGVPWAGELSDTDTLGGKAEPALPIEQHVAVVTTAANIVEHHKSRGTLPGSMVDKANAYMQPSKVPWQQVLASTVRRAVAIRAGQRDVTYQRHNRRFPNAVLTDRHGNPKGRMILPGPYSPLPTIRVIRDTSGSMSSDDLAAVTREVAAISARLGIRGSSLTVTDVDATAHATRQWTSRNSLDSVEGRGGTDMRVGIDAALAERKNRPDVIVVITDGYTPWPDINPGRPIVACIVGEGTSADSVAADVPDWIRTVVVQPEGHHCLSAGCSRL